ncbi:transcriptional regulator family: Fungal Specific TF [Penicillium macrosclerotiorum]|uniref:transcriptional regulator family: Fungal Specific TF n=1 Tax=Penicillium macrosclerotiorum TaxID=303699 RepID=UPI00254779EA|nr:transcriptional regulator family: Fungal Specific TF [Penicillium macrosclerotiorum]KAJ5679327.1 transcriptional regulator family: Fungal Specific TF [Penicillium macrosclerotiorum]
MRLSISCDACRRAKVKCVHEGNPPCRRCQKTKADQCVLTDPRASERWVRRNTVASRTPRKRRTIDKRSLASGEDQPKTRSTSREIFKSDENPISALPPSTVITAIETYRKKFPIANFLHYPSLISDISTDFDSVDPIFIASLLSLCARFMNDTSLEEEGVYASYAQRHLSQRVMEAPSLYLAQSLVMISFYEWGTGRPYQAWIMEHSPHEFHASQTQYEQLVRTYWCCFAQDCELSSGARQHFALSFSQISVPLPISDRDFTFNHLPERRLMPADMNKQCPQANNLTIENGLTIVTRGFDVFVRILRFANEHRRAVTSVNIPEDSAVSPLHQTWQRLKGELDEWRSLQDRTVKYPATSAQAHPHSDVFHDMNDDDHYQPETIKQLFEAAQHISSVLLALEASEAAVMTPYSGFSVFVAAHINMYGTLVPQWYPGGLERAEEEKNRNMTYLERLSKLWPVGQNWWRTVQEANRFYETVKSTQAHPESGMHSPRRFALAGTLDEYGDIRSRPTREPHVTRSGTAEVRAVPNTPPTQGSMMSSPGPQGDSAFFPRDHSAIAGHHDFEADMFQWPFIDGSWSAGFDAGLDGLWHHSGLFDPNPPLR